MSNIEQLEISLEEAKKLVSRKDKALKLASNREFKELVLEGYFEKEAARLVSICADPLMEKQRESIQMQMQAISCFRQFLSTIVMMGQSAEGELVDYNEALDEARAEELGA